MDAFTSPLEQQLRSLAQGLSDNSLRPEQACRHLQSLAYDVSHGAYQEVLAWLEVRQKNNVVESIVHKGPERPTTEAGYTRLALTPLGLLGQWCQLYRPVQELMDQMMASASRAEEMGMVPGAHCAHLLRQAAEYMAASCKHESSSVDLDIIRNSYGFMVATDGAVWGLTAGDHHWEKTGIVCDMEKDGWVQAVETGETCNFCHTCLPASFTQAHMILCPDCGNKRCPRASWHKNPCTHSNAPGQVGSIYTASSTAPADDYVEEAFLDRVLDPLHRQQGDGGSLYKAAMDFMLDRRSLREKWMAPRHKRGETLPEAQETVVQSLMQARGWTREYAQGYVEDLARLQAPKE